MKKSLVLLKKSITTLRDDGIKAFIIKSVNYIKKSIRFKTYSNNPEKGYWDVLFVNGTFLPQCVRYRVAHQREQLLANGVTSNEVFYKNLNLKLVKRYRVFIFFRCPYTDVVGEFIEQAKKLNKRVLFDVDDLVIDRKYTDNIPYIQMMSARDKASYDEGVAEIQKTLRLCDAAITTTDQLAEELKKYVSEVFVNRNVASEKMLQLSNEEIEIRDQLPYRSLKSASSWREYIKIVQAKRAQKRNSKYIRIGYFSGSITHNDDIQIILPCIIAIMKKYNDVQLYLVGELAVPKELEQFQERVVTKPFVSWERLPKLIASVDINIVPLVDTIFNAAKSENKWAEAALVKVPTIASEVGAFKQVIENGKTGILCRNTADWDKALTMLIEDESMRLKLGEAAYRYVVKNKITTYSGYPVSEFIKQKMTPNIIFVLPSTQISGGVLVALTHATILSDAGLDVLILNNDLDENDIKHRGKTMPVISVHRSKIVGSIDKIIATLWTTLETIKYTDAFEKYYLVQGFETDFYKPGNPWRLNANMTYSLSNIKYITVSKWCARWLKEKFNRNADYIQNGIDIKNFEHRQRNFADKKIRILIEGNSDDFYKNVDESFKIVEKLDATKYEIWFMSYQGKPKEWYRVDKFLHKVPHAQIQNVYLECDILLKTSILESFSYPPLEMMATGGYVVAIQNEGNAEYLRNEDNCLLYQQGNLEMAVQAILRLSSDEKLRQKLYKGGLHTAMSRDWKGIKWEILEAYQVKLVGERGEKDENG